MDKREEEMTEWHERSDYSRGKIHPNQQKFFGRLTRARTHTEEFYQVSAYSLQLAPSNHAGKASSRVK